MQIWTPPSIKRASGGLVWTLHEKECPGSDLQAPWEMDTGVPLRVSPAFSECSSSRACKLLHVLATSVTVPLCFSLTEESTHSAASVFPGSWEG